MSPKKDKKKGRNALYFLFRDGKFLQVLRVIIFALLCVLCVVVAVSSIRLGTLAVIMTASASAVLIVSMAVKIFAMGTPADIAEVWIDGIPRHP